jgi:hypothetical protein
VRIYLSYQSQGVIPESLCRGSMLTTVDPPPVTAGDDRWDDF